MQSIRLKASHLCESPSNGGMVNGIHDIWVSMDRVVRRDAETAVDVELAHNRRLRIPGLPGPGTTV